MKVNQNSFLRTKFNVTILFSLILFFGSAQQTLAPGDIAVVGFKTSGGTQGGNDAFKLMNLVDLQCGTQFIVTDNNRRDNGTWFCNDDEFAIEITVNSIVIAGSVIYVEVDAANGTTTSSTGAISQASLGNPWGTNFGFNSGGDNLSILQGTRAAPNFIFALKHNGTFASAGDCSSKNNTSLPSGLTLGSNAVQMATSEDQWHYNCATAAISGTKATILAAIANNTNWTSAAGQQWNSTSCAFTITDTPYMPTGSLSVSGTGCGCLSGCNLTSMGGPNCGSGTSGDCTAGYQPMFIDISVPAGCTYTINATMRPWTSGFTCSTGGADGNCATCDVLKVDLPGGAKVVKQGTSNATLNDSYTLTGPGTIRVSGRANRSDEIIAYRVLSSACASCGVFALPVELVDFNAQAEGEAVRISWQTQSERENDFFTTERSIDGMNWEPIAQTYGHGNSQTPHFYTIFDTNPLQGTSYYRLKQTDFNGTSSYSKLAAVKFGKNQSEVIKRVNLLGQNVDETAKGIVILVFANGETEKIFVD